MIPDHVISRIFNGTCGIGIIKTDRKDQLQHNKEGFEICGTAFLVRTDVVMTNRHVVEGMMQRLAELKIDDGKHVAAQFTYPIPGGMQQSFVPIGKTLVSQHPVIDVALLQFAKYPESNPDFVSSVKRLSILESVDELRLGEAVGVMGFPYGSDMLVEGRADPVAIVRAGPLLQQGYISGFRPWQQTFGIHDIILDVRTINGMSGSPVFRQETGQVIGLIHGGIGETVEQGDIKIHIPHFAIARAVPLDWVRLSGLLCSLDSGQPGMVESGVSY